MTAEEKKLKCINVVFSGCQREHRRRDQNKTEITGAVELLSQKYLNGLSASVSRLIVSEDIVCRCERREMNDVFSKTLMFHLTLLPTMLA